VCYGWYQLPQSQILMEESDSLRCKMALKVIDAFLAKNRSFRVTLGDLRGPIILLGENEAELSRGLREKWRILEEIRAYTLYQRSSDISPESRASINMTLDEMKRLIRVATPDSRAMSERDSPLKER
jgi:hypothetical protein